MVQSELTAKSSRFVTLASIVLIVAILYFAQELLIPLALAALFSFMLAPLVRRLQRLKLPRAVAVVIATSLALGVVGCIGLVVYNQMTDLAGQLPQYRENIDAKVVSLRSGGGIFANLKIANEEVQHLIGPATLPTSRASAHPDNRAPVPVVVTGERTFSSSSPGTPWQLIGDVGGKLLGPTGTAFVVVVFTIFMLLQLDDLRDRLIRLVGQSRLSVTTDALNDAANRVSRYLLMQLVINGTVGITVMIGLWTIGTVNGQAFPSPALWGLLACLLRFIPYVGIWVSAIMPLLLSLAVFSSAKVALETLCGYMAIEVIAANVMEPLLFGSSTGIATLAILVAAAFWTWLWGPVGLLLSTPMTVCLVVLGKHVPQMEFLNVLLGDEPALRPPDRVYQRLLAMDEENAQELINDYAKKMPPLELYDNVLLPVLAMAQRDRQLGSIDEERVNFILHGIRNVVDEIGDVARTATSPVDGVRLMLPKGCEVKLAFLPAHSEADEIASFMFAQLLEGRGYCCMVISSEKLIGEHVEILQKSNVDLACISALPPVAVTHARYLCKRLSGNLPQLGLLVGLWTDTTDVKRTGARLSVSTNIQLSTSLAQALEMVGQMVQPLLVGKEPRNSGALSAPAPA